MQLQTEPVSGARTTNGFDLDVLSGLADHLKASAEAGRVTFIARSRWQHGARVLNHVSGYSIDGQMQHEARRAFVTLIDEPVELSGTDAAPGPVEMLLHAIGSCISATTAANAAFMGVRLTRLEVAIESDLDLHGFFGIDEQVRPGIGSLRIQTTLAGDADEETLREVARRGYRYSPVRDSVDAGVDIQPKIIVTD